MIKKGRLSDIESGLCERSFIYRDGGFVFFFFSLFQEETKRCEDFKKSLKRHSDFLILAIKNSHFQSGSLKSI